MAMLLLNLIPVAIGLTIGAILYSIFHWWFFFVIFPWIGTAISIGIFVRHYLPKRKKGLGRKTAMLLILPLMLFVIPIYNRENFQLEGVVLIVLVGIFSKGFIHYAIAKLFGPLIWGRGFCGWACWTAAVLEWLPIRGRGAVPPGLKNLRYLVLALSVLLPVILVFGLSYDVRGHYLNKTELWWMLVGNAVYYALAIPLAFAYKDKRAFCKIACPVALVMKPATSLARLRKTPTGEECTECGACNKACPMDIDVMTYIRQERQVTHTECILCEECQFHCPTDAIC